MKTQSKMHPACCNHREKSGAGWWRCSCGARCERDERGIIVEYEVPGAEQAVRQLAVRQ